MSGVQYGVRYGVRFDDEGGAINWYNSESDARAIVGYEQRSRTLVASEVGETYDVKDPLPGTPGSVIRDKVYGLLVLDADGRWGSFAYAPLVTTIEQNGWTLVFDAGVIS